MSPDPPQPEASVSVAEFLSSMPIRYRKRFDWVAARRHAHIAHARGKSRAHADTFERDGQVVLCVVAPDAPGVLSAISAGILLTGFDIQQAEAYVRRPARSPHEAVDLFWLRRESGNELLSLSAKEVTSILFTLTELLQQGGVLSPARHSRTTKPDDAETTVRFLERVPEQGPELTLEVETSDRTGLLATLSAALFAEGVQIVASRIKTSGFRAADQFDLIDADGSQLSGTRLQRVKLGVLAALDQSSPLQGLVGGSERPRRSSGAAWLKRSFG